VCTVQYFVNTTHSREHESAARDTTSPGTSLFHRTPKHPVTALSPGFRPSLDTVQSIRSPGFLVFEPRRRRHAGGTVSFCHVLASVAVLPLWLPAYGARRLTLTHSFKPSRRSPGEAIPYHSQPPAHRVLRDDASNRSRWPFFPSDQWLSEAPFRAGARSLASLGRFGLIAFAGRRQASTKQSWPASQDKTGPAAVSDLGPWRAWNGGDGYVGVGICIGIN
jgi:hypothetical protein